MAVGGGSYLLALDGPKMILWILVLLDLVDGGRWEGSWSDETPLPPWFGLITAAAAEMMLAFRPRR